MKSEFSTDDIKYLASKSEVAFKNKGYKVKIDINSIEGKYGCVYYFENGRMYTTGLDSKDICAKKVINIMNNIDEMVVKYCAINNI